MPVDVVVGLQWGSEGKGKVVGLIAHQYKASIRVGGPNAGHTLYSRGQKLVCHSVPCAFVNPECRLYIAAGAVIDPTKLAAEIKTLEQQTGLEIASRLMVDWQAAIIHPDDMAMESAMSNGSTQQGVGLAESRKVQRMPSDKPRVVAEWASQLGPSVSPGFLIGDTRRDFERFLVHDRVLIEGTQGALLSIHHGSYPHVTSRDTTAAALLSDAGIAPRYLERVFGVMRPFPIRVSGPSGPMGDEITWQQVAAEAGLRDVPDERTTVTKRERRVARINLADLRRAAMLNGVTHLCVMFADYLDGRIRDMRPSSWEQLERLPKVNQNLATYAVQAGAPVHMVSYGPTPDETFVLPNGVPVS